MASGPLRLHFYDPLTLAYVSSCEDVLDAAIIIDQIDRAEAHTVRLASIHAETIASLTVKTRVAVEDTGDEGAGIVAWGVIMNPAQSIARTGGGEINLTIYPLMEELHWVGTGYGYADSNPIGTVVANLGGIGTYPRSILDYAQVDPQGYAGYDPSGDGRTATILIPGQSVGWSAAFVDDGALVPSNAPVRWDGILPGVTPAGNSVKKDADAARSWSGATGVPMGTDAARDYALSFRVVDGTKYQYVGLTPFPSFAANAVAFGFDFTGGVWRILENGATPTGIGISTYPFVANTRFTVKWNAATGQIIYYVSAPGAYDVAFISAHAAASPLVPHALMYDPGAEVLDATVAATVPRSQQWYRVRYDAETVWGASVQVADDTGYHVRQGRDDRNEPTRALEVGPFGVQTAIRFIDGTGGDASKLTAAPNNRVIDTITQTGPDATNLVNLSTPLGGGGDNPVTLEHLWRTLNDPRYENYGRYAGGVRIAQGDMFPEYDPNYPIYRRPKGIGGYEYYMRSERSIAAYGEMQGGTPDSQISYADQHPTAAVIELTERALYTSWIAKFGKSDTPLLTLTFTTEGRGKPLRAGDFAYVEYHNLGNVNGVPFVRMDVDEWFQVLRHRRTYGRGGGSSDEWLVSNTGRYRPTDASYARDQARQLQKTQIAQSTAVGYATWPTAFRELDAVNDVVLDLKLLPNVTRVQQAYLRVRFEQYRQPVSVAENQASGIDIRIGDVNIALPATADLNALAAPIAQMPKHFHQMTVGHGFRPIDAVPDNLSNFITGISHGENGRIDLFMNGGPNSAYIGTSDYLLTPDLGPTAHPHVVAKSGDRIAHIPSQTVLATMPPHTHTLRSEIVLKDRPAAVQVWVDSGDGAFANRTPELLDQVSNRQGGAAGFTGDFEVEISRYLTMPGRTARIRLVSVANASNPLGLGAIAYSGTFAIEYSGLAATARAQQ